VLNVDILNYSLGMILGSMSTIKLWLSSQFSMKDLGEASFT